MVPHGRSDRASAPPHSPGGAPNFLVRYVTLWDAEDNEVCLPAESIRPMWAFEHGRQLRTLDEQLYSLDQYVGQGSGSIG